MRVITPSVYLLVDDTYQKADTLNAKITQGLPGRETMKRMQPLQQQYER